LRRHIVRANQEAVVLDVDAVMGQAAFRADPYPFWARLRSTQPVHRAGTGLWLLTRYSDVDAALRDGNFSSDQARLPTRLRALGQPAAEAMERIFGRSMLHLDPPAHTRLRRHVYPFFSPRRVMRMRPLVQHIADLLIDAVEPLGQMDAMADFANPLPITVIFEVFDIPFSDRVHLAEVIRRHRESRLRLVVERVRRPVPQDKGEGERAATASSAIQQLEDTAGELREYLSNLLRTRSKGDGEDLLSELQRTSLVPTNSEQLTDAELVGTAMLLLVAGQETTINLIGNGLLALLRHPRELARLKADPGLVPGAIEELLRYDTPIQVIARVLLQDVVIDGTCLPLGSEVLLVTAAANRDPERFNDPDRIDVTRQGAGHLSFGGGHHYCLGAPLARLEAEVAFRTLTSRLPRLGLATEDLRWRPNPFLRGLEELPVRF